MFTSGPLVSGRGVLKGSQLESAGESPRQSSLLRWDFHIKEQIADTENIKLVAYNRHWWEVVSARVSNWAFFPWLSFSWLNFQLSTFFPSQAFLYHEINRVTCVGNSSPSSCCQGHGVFTLRLFCCSLLPVTEYYDISLDKEPWKTLDIIMLGSEIGGADNPSSRDSFSVQNNIWQFTKRMYIPLSFRPGRPLWSWGLVSCLLAIVVCLRITEGLSSGGQNKQTAALS